MTSKPFGRPRSQERPHIVAATLYLISSRAFDPSPCACRVKAVVARFGAYVGGALPIEDTFGVHSVKLPAGDLIVYPATSLHRVEPVTRGARVGCFFWIQSLVRDAGPTKRHA